MNLDEIVRTAWRALNLNRTRSLLTMLGVIIGVFAVVMLVSVVNGVKIYVQDQFNSLGSNLIYVMPGKFNPGGDPATSMTNSKLRDKQVEDIQSYATDYVARVSPMFEAGATLTRKTQTYSAVVDGLPYDSFDMMSLQIDSGRFYSQSEENSKKRVLVIGSDVKQKLYGDVDPVGDSIKVKDDRFEIIGVLKSKGQNWDTIVILPTKVALEIFDEKSYSSVVVQFRDGADPNLAKKAIRTALLRSLKDDEFTVMTQEDLLSSINNVLNMISLILAAVAGISLLVGGIGIMNIMLVSVTERTSEIGLRKALGASTHVVALQFMAESIMLSVIGGLIGLGLSFGAAFIVNKFISTEIPLWVILLSLGFSLLVGTGFGTYPAISAAKKDPIEALRYE